MTVKTQIYNFAPKISDVSVVIYILYYLINIDNFVQYFRVLNDKPVFW